MEDTTAKRQVEEARRNVLGPQIEAGEEAKQVFEELSDLNPNTELDCKEFGEHVRNGGWRLGLLVARNVYEEYGGKVEGKPWEAEGISQATWYRRQADKTDSPESLLSKKISGRAFARQAGGVSQSTVSRHLKAWNAAADAGFVPHSSTLNPGDRFEFSQGEPE